jgi:hypothetical protein
MVAAGINGIWTMTRPPDCSAGNQGVPLYRDFNEHNAK